MPTYEYTCKKCGENIEVWQSFNAKPLNKHEDCGGELKKVFHARGVVFKGSGFYKTDSRPAASESNGKTEKSEKTSTDKKPAEKSTAKTAKTSSEPD